MQKTMITPNYILLDFFKLGFCTKEAFVNICREMNSYISKTELYLVWEFGLMCSGVENFLKDVIENLKNE